MRRLIIALALFSAPISLAYGEKETAPEPALTETPLVFSETITPEALSTVAAKLERLSRSELVRIAGGRQTASQRRELSEQALHLSRELSAAATALRSANMGQSSAAQALQTARNDAMMTAYSVASSVSNLDVRQDLFDLLEGPPPEAPQPKSYIFCMEASGAGPNTFRRYAAESLTQAIPYVQGYVTHEIKLTAPFKLRLDLTVEHGADSAPFAAIDALHAANKDAVTKMDEPDRRAAETILMGEFAERLCSPTPTRGQ